MDAPTHRFTPTGPALDLRASLPAHLPSLTGRARRLARTRADADDLVQETMLRALRFETTFERGTNLRAWLHRILETVFLSRCRRGSRERAALGRLARDPALTAPSAPGPVLRVVSNRMDDALRALPASFRGVVTLVDLGDRSYREAAEELGIPVGTVMSRLFRARKLLAGSLGEAARAATARAA